MSNRYPISSSGLLCVVLTSFQSSCGWERWERILDGCEVAGVEQESEMREPNGGRGRLQTGVG